MQGRSYDVVVVGGGVIGSALLYVLAKYTNVQNVLLLEKAQQIGSMVSSSRGNSQTLHFGDIETNYTFEKAKQVNEYASWVAKFLETNDPKQSIYKKYNKMVLGVGDDEVNLLKKRYDDFKDLFPGLRKIFRDELAQIEPNVVLGRDEDENIMALFTEDGYTVDFGALACMFVEKALVAGRDKDFKLGLGVQLKKVVDCGDFYDLKTTHGEVKTKVVVFCVGGYSLTFAKSLGYAQDFSVLPIAGTFYHTPHLLNGKVYTVQDPSLPFAAVHGDPDLDHHDKTRFGPIAKIVPLLEQKNAASMAAFIKTFGFSWGAMATLFKLAFNLKMSLFILLQTLCDLPVIGKYLFIRDVRKIVPTAKVSYLKKAKGCGGVRPQIIDTKKKWLSFGTARIVGKNAIFNVTPSPGASTCLASALDDVKKVVEFLGESYTFDEEAFKRDLSL